MRTTITIAAAAAFIPAASTHGASANSGAFLEPNVQRYAGVVPASVCRQLIELGEKAGFLETEESIDEDLQREAENDPTKKFVPAQQLDVWEKDSDPTYEDSEDEVTVLNQEIYDVLQPWIPAISDVVKQNRNREGFAKYYPDEPDREPELNWVFFRKYSPDDERNSLQHHHDTNMNTVNIALNDDYEGGGFFYIRPLASTGEVHEKFENKKKYGYKWIDSLKKENTSEIVFPDLRTGDVVFYNYTVQHAVAPVVSGTRYAMAFFFDMDNPAVRDDFDSEDDSEDGSEDEEDGEYEDDEYNEDDEDEDNEYDADEYGEDDEDEDDKEDFGIFLHNGLADDKIDIARVYEAGGQEMLRTVIRKMAPGGATIYNAFRGTS